MNKSPLGETGCLSKHYTLLVTQASRLLIHSRSLIHALPLTQLVRLPWVTYHLVCSACVTYGKPSHSIGQQALPTQPFPREAEDFSKGERGGVGGEWQVF